ncbi:MAG: ubiquitin-conjugating enzyme E2 [Amphiamblys sp. WSBS2006]|nr:MAG: ubiquitin-conjugating enzyme E2 [Amphiamblys sp. WSBS2006]
MKHTGIVLLFAALSVSCLRETEAFRKRINNELKNIRKKPASLVSVTMFGEEKQTSSISIVQAEENSLFKWKATMQGPEGTPFEGGIFELDVTLPDGYPFYPPRIKFLSEMFHPNIYEDGSICLDVLRERWSPAQTIFSALLSIQSLLTDPNPHSNSEADFLFLNNRPEYDKRVRATVMKTKPGSEAKKGPSGSPRDCNPSEGNIERASHEEQIEEAFD